MKPLLYFIGGLLLFYIGYLLLLRLSKKEGFSQKPLLEISQAIDGIQPIAQKYVSSSNSSEMTQQLDTLLSDIKTTSDMITKMKTKCSDDECGFTQTDLQTAIPAVEQMTMDVQKWMASMSNIISTEDQQLLQSNLEIIRGYEYMLSIVIPESPSSSSMPSSTSSSMPSSMPTSMPSSMPTSVSTSPVPTATMSSTSSPSFYN